MSVIPFKTPTRDELLDHVEVLLLQVKDFNATSNELKVSKVVLAGNVLTPSKSGNSLYLQFTDKKGEVFPPVLALDQVLTNQEKQKYLDNENKWFENHNFLISNYIQIKSLAEKEVSPFKSGEAKIVFSKQMMPSPELKYSLSIKKDYFTEKKLDFHINKISQRPKV
jgi:hypothetical protein